MSIKYSPYAGPYSHNFDSLKGKLIDATNGDGGLRGLRVDLPNFTEVKLELAQGIATGVGATAGIPQDVYDNFVECNEIVDSIDVALLTVEKQAEVLRESRAFYVDARQNNISIMVDSMTSRAQRRKDTALLQPFEKTLKYYSQLGDKAHKTRKQKATKAATEAAESAEAAKQDAAVKAQIDAYKAELDAKFAAAVKDAVEKKLAESKPTQAA